MSQYQGWTRYRYWLTVERLLQAIERLEDWRPRLNGPWRSPQERR
ncbi:MAG TPA: hypothetical protein PKK10_04170 [Woeseiaceae bacterium]|nr:hypothetical protein [Woeseiaceae bacterium]